jgi:hypothetical protein
MISLKRLIPVVQKGAKECLERCGYVSPMLVRIIDGMLTFCPLELPATNSNQVLVQFLREAVANGLQEFILVTECWLADVPQEKFSELTRYKKEHGSLAGHPRASEAIQVFYASPQESCCFYANIKRNSTNQPHAEEFAKLPGSPIAGLFSDLFR